MIPAGAGDGERGLPLPTPVNPDLYVEYRICIPDSWQYRAALLGAITGLGFWWTWQHTRDDRDAAEEAASLFRESARFASFEGECMTFCEKLIQCIETDADSRAAIVALMNDAINNNPATRNAIEGVVQYNDTLRDYFRSVAAQSVLTTEQRNQSLLALDACDYGYLFSQANTVITKLDEASVALMSSLAPSSDPINYARLFMDAVPIIGSVIPTAIIEAAALALHDFTVAAYEDGYDAIFVSLRCGIWCLIKDDCYLSIDRLIEYYTLRSGFSIPVDPFDAFKTVIETITEGGFTDERIVYLLHLLVLNAMRMKQKIFDLDFGYYALDILASATTDNPDWIDCDACDDSACFNPSNFGTGTVIAQSGGNMTIQTQSASGEQRIVWSAPDPEEGCLLISIDTLVGVYTSYQIVTVADENIEISALPATIKYVYMAKPEGSAMIQRWKFI